VRALLALLCLLLSVCAAAQTYYPDANWQRKAPAEVGIDAGRLKEAVDYAIASEVRNPRDLTLEFSKADRGDRIFVDVGRNGYSATFAAAYAVRARPGAPVSAPCSWDELERGEVGPRTFSVRGMAHRIEKVGDLWSEMYEQTPSLGRSFERLRTL